MEQEKNKRAREYYNDVDEKGFSFNHKNKKRDVCGISFTKGKEKVEEEKGSCYKTWDWDSHLAMGVFDFPWLKDGVIFKSEEEEEDYFEDNFLSSLQSQDTNSFKNIDFFEEYEYALCEAPMVVEDLLKPFEINELDQMMEPEDLDCIWSSLLNEPL